MLSSLNHSFPSQEQLQFKNQGERGTWGDAGIVGREKVSVQLRPSAKQRPAHLLGVKDEKGTRKKTEKPSSMSVGTEYSGKARQV